MTGHVSSRTDAAKAMSKHSLIKRSKEFGFDSILKIVTFYFLNSVLL